MNYTGITFLYASRIFSLGGDPRNALEAAVTAKGVLEAGTSPYHLASAYRRVFDLTGKHVYRRRADALSADFRVIPGGFLSPPLANLNTFPQVDDGLFGNLLTPRQSEIAELLQLGKTNREIGHDLKSDSIHGGASCRVHPTAARTALGGNSQEKRSAETAKARFGQCTPRILNFSLRRFLCR